MLSYEYSLRLRASTKAKKSIFDTESHSLQVSLERLRQFVPVGTSTSLVHVLDGTDEVLPNPGVVGILDSMLLANLPHSGSNVGVPRRGHSGEQVVLDLEVETTGKSTGNESTVGRGGLDLGLEPTDGLSALPRGLGGVAIGSLKVVRQGKETGQGQALGDAEEKDLSEGGPGPTGGEEGADDVPVDVQKADGDGILATALDEVVVHADSDGLGTALLEVEDLNVEHRRKPVEGEEGEEEESLESVPEAAVGVVEGIVVEGHHGLGAEGVGILGGVIGVGMVGPVLLHPEPLAAADEVGTEAEDIVDPGLLGCGSVVGVVLNVEANAGLGHAQEDGQGPGRADGHPEVLEGGHDADVGEGPGKVSPGTELPSPPHDLEHLPLDLALEGGVEDVVPLHISVVDLADGSHFLQVLGRVIRVDHLVLDRDVVATEQQDGVATGMLEVGKVVDGVVDDDLVSLEVLDRIDARTGGLVAGGIRHLVAGQGRLLAVAKFSVGGHILCLSERK